MQQPMQRDKALTLAQTYANDFLAGRGAELWGKLTPEMKRFIGDDQAKWNMISASIPQQLGKITQVKNERIISGADIQNYTRLITTDTFPGEIVVSVALTPSGLIAGIGARPVPNPAESRFLDYKLKTAYRFPLSGQWTIYQGGRSVYDNYHAAFADQRFAYDILRFEDGSMFKDDGSELQNFFAFGQPVLAVASCKVVSAEDQYDDNPLNKPSSTFPKQGNSIVLDCGQGEYALYAHLQRGSVKAKSGDNVKAGQVIGAVGNSGNSPIPHLHFHLQNGPTWLQGQGLPIAFQKIVVNGKSVTDVAPVRGDVVQAQ
jgi:murein DD-endopeptidase MepM/ murein hydrolase activator NlpD